MWTHHTHASYKSHTRVRIIIIFKFLPLKVKISGL